MEIASLRQNLGATALSRYAQKSCGVEMSVDQAKAWINTFRQEIYPEIGRYLAGPNIAQTFGRKVGLPSLPSSNHVRLFKNTISSPGQINQLTAGSWALKRRCISIYIHWSIKTKLIYIYFQNRLLP